MRYKYFLFFGILIVNFCSESYIQFDPKVSVNRPLFQKNTPTILYSYMINKEAILVLKDEMGIKNNYRVFIEDSEPFWDIYKEVFQSHKVIKQIDSKKILTSKTVLEIPKVEEEKYVNLSYSPLYIEKVQKKLIPKIAKDLEVKQLILARIDFDLQDEPKEIDKSLLIVKLTVLILNENGEYVYATERRKSILTYLPDDDISLANVLGDIFNATVKGNVYIKVNKHIRPQIYTILGELWKEVIIDLEK